MRYLLDTHILLWWLTTPEKLSIKAKNIIADIDNQIFVSSVSMWEMAIKSEIGKLNIPQNLLATLRNERLQILQLAAEEALAVADLPKIHNDPFDRMLVVQAKFNDLVFVTRDPQILEYPIICVKA
ncbi:MAG TPA: type II toxin-antitoxin system VapC family toxin [Gammaproteobacteria bacterium]|nr:type II toxin-antitoxin system VapC family toxin [Gammaproteobacteria bacterium]